MKSVDGETNLQAAFLGVVAATSEQSWRFDSEVSNFLLATIKETGRIFGFHVVLGLLCVLLLLCGHGLFLGLLTLEVFKDGTEIAQGKVRDLCTITLSNTSIADVKRPREERTGGCVFITVCQSSKKFLLKTLSLACSVSSIAA